MGAIKSYVYEFWTTPFPQFFADKISKLFRPLVRVLTKHWISDKTYLICVWIVTALAAAVVLVCSGSLNPLDLLFEIPYLSANEYLASISNWTNFTWTEYLVFTSVVSMAVLGLIHLVLLRKQEYSILTVQGISSVLMAILVTLAVDGVCQETFRSFHETYLTNSLANPYSLLTAVAANFALYFFLQDALSTVLSFSLTPAICKAIHVNLSGLGLVHFLVVAVLLKGILAVLEKIGVWNIVVYFIKKWIYTPKYMMKIVAVLFSIFLLPFIWPFIILKLKKKKEEQK